METEWFDWPARDGIGAGPPRFGLSLVGLKLEQLVLVAWAPLETHHRIAAAATSTTTTTAKARFDLVVGATANADATKLD